VGREGRNAFSSRAERLSSHRDDTNPTQEEEEFVEAIKQDVRWLGCDWGEHLYYASDYFRQMYEYAVQLIEAGKAYVDDQSAEEIRRTRGTLTQPGQESPYRNRSVRENLELFERMKNGEFPDGSRVLRAKIDMASPNLNLRDPVMYRILHVPHHRTKDTWCIYPTYDWAHGLEDSIEKVTHSICTLEFENHRPLRRRGFTPEAIRAFMERVGVNKFNSTVDIALLEHCLREDLNRRCRRVMAVLRPLRVVIENYPEDLLEEMEAVNHPEDPAMGTRKVPFSRVLYIERDDFRQDPPRKFYRLAPGREVRLRYAYFITCREVVKDENGEVVELRCTYDPATRGGDAPDGRKVKSTLHWVSAEHALPAEVRLYDHLFTKENPEDVAEGQDFKVNLNPDSLEVLTGCRVEPSLGSGQPGDLYQFERLGYFCVDPDASADKLIFNRTVSLRDTWAKIEKAQQKGGR